MAAQTDPPPPAMSTHDPTIMRHPHQLHPAYDFRAMHAPATDFAAHMQMPHIPLPLDTPLPPSAYDFTSHGVFHIPASMQGPQGHPLFEGVVAMHQMFGHDLNISWSDMASCAQQSAISYPHESATTYACEPMMQWPSPPGSIMDSTPSPLEESMPHTPEHFSDHASEPLVVTGDSPPAPSQPLPHLTITSGYNRFPVVVTGTKTHEHTVAFQYDVSLPRPPAKLILNVPSSDKSRRKPARSLTRTLPISYGISSASSDGTSSLPVWPRDARLYRSQGKSQPTAALPKTVCSLTPSPATRAAQLSLTSSSRSKS